MAGQGRVLQDEVVHNIVSLLFSTEMTISQISERTGCSRSAILCINRKFQVRDYSGHRSSWRVSTESASVAAAKSE